MNTPLPLSRRDALRRVIGVSLALSALDIQSFGAAAGARGIGRDPDLHDKVAPWPRVLTEQEKRIVAALSDAMIPADENGPAATAVGVPDFIDEWVSAPYTRQESDLQLIRGGLAWIDDDAKKRFGKGFADCTAAQNAEILADVVKGGSDARKQAYAFFRTFRELVCGGYYSTPEGWKAIGYVGNVAIPEFPGPPPEVLKHLGLA